MYLCRSIRSVLMIARALSNGLKRLAGSGFPHIIILISQTISSVPSWFGMVVVVLLRFWLLSITAALEIMDTLNSLLVSDIYTLI